MPEAPLIFGYLRDHRVANSLQTRKILQMHFPPWGVKTERQVEPNRAALHHRDVIYLVHNREGLCASDKIRLTSLPLSAMRTQQMSLNLHKAICALERRCVLKRGAINSRVVLNRVETLYMEKAGMMGLMTSQLVSVPKGMNMLENCILLRPLKHLEQPRRHFC